ncbi:hypothetical protein [Nesterenkonia sp. K-15-9-6]|uniref:hypothetical protein n=1 Tax=Nesterenkonia sp. K-15-9-6 TaxID=3093918 RepID=UPI004044B2C8
MSTENTTPMTKEDRLAFILRKTISDLVTAEVKTEREHVVADLLARFEEDGIKQLSVNLPDGEAIATLTITQPKPKTTIRDEDKLLAWAEENRPDLVEEVPAHRVLSATALAELAKSTTVVDGEHVTEDGETVPGLRTTTAAPSSFMVKYAQGDESRARLIEAWKDGELAEIDTGETVPQLDWTGVKTEEAA